MHLTQGRSRRIIHCKCFVQLSDKLKERRPVKEGVGGARRGVLESRVSDGKPALSYVQTMFLQLISSRYYSYSFGWWCLCRSNRSRDHCTGRSDEGEVGGVETDGQNCRFVGQIFAVVSKNLSLPLLPLPLLLPLSSSDRCRAKGVTCPSKRADEHFPRIEDQRMRSLIF